MEHPANAVTVEQSEQQQHTAQKSKKKSKNKNYNGKTTEGSTQLKIDKEQVADRGISEKLSNQLHITDNHTGHCCNGVNGIAGNHKQEDGIDADPVLNGHHTEYTPAAAGKANGHVVAPTESKKPKSKSNKSKRKEQTAHADMTKNCATHEQVTAAVTALENGHSSASEEQLHDEQQKNEQNRKQQKIGMASAQQSSAQNAVAINNGPLAVPKDIASTKATATSAVIICATSPSAATEITAASNTAKQSIAITTNAAAAANTTTKPTKAAEAIETTAPTPTPTLPPVATSLIPTLTLEAPLDLSNVHIEYKEYESELQMHDIMRLIQAELSEPYSIYTYRYFIYNWPKLCFLAAHGNEYVGAIVCKLDLHMNVKRGYIAMLAVRKEYRKLKIGTTLVQKAIEAMLADNAAEVVLETEMRNVPALRLYENLGFVRDKRLFRYYLNGVDALRLKLWFR